MKNTTSDPTEYFAAIPADQPDELASAIVGKIKDWREYAIAKGLLGMWSKKLKNYYGNSANGNSSQGVNAGGSEGELSLIKVNDLHRLVQEQLVLVTSQRPAGIARAVNSDSKSLKASAIGTAVAEHYMTDAKSNFEGKFVEACETAILCDEAFVDLYWDRTIGEPIRPDTGTGEMILSGDAVLRTHQPWNVARDIGCPVDSQKWHIISYEINKFDAAAAYPRFADVILGGNKDSVPPLDIAEIPEDSDMIWAHLLVHDRTPAVPKGRYSIVIADKLVHDSAVGLEYPEYPIERMSPSNVIGGITGYSATNDVLAMEEVTDSLHSIVTTNNVTFGGQSIIIPQGAGMKPTDLAKGLRAFEVPLEMVDKIVPLQMTRSAPETYSYINSLSAKKDGQMGSVQGVLSQQASQGASGSAMALVQATSVQYNSGTQRAYFRMLSATMTKLIGVLRTFADEPKVARIVGKSKAAGLKEFKYTGEDLDSVSAIAYEMVDAISQTVGGKLQMAQDLLNAPGMITTPKQYLMVAKTGNLDVMTNNSEMNDILLVEENEYLAEGKPVLAVFTEMHEDHIAYHQGVLASVGAKEDPSLVTATMAHIQQHLDLWMQLSAQKPQLLLATGQKVLPPPPVPGMPGVSPAGLDDQGQGGGGKPPGDAGAPQAPGLAQPGSEAREPQMPMNPATGERAQVPGAPA